MKALYELPAPAKLNLFLHVVGKRADGYHLLQSLFVPIDWMDTLHLERRGDGRLQRHDLRSPLPEDDLCLRAARLLREASGCEWGADIHIDKRIPSGAGMGGGSSDAATVLIGLNRLWGLNWSLARLAPLALRMGADVPFFLGSGPAFAEGVGELLQPTQFSGRRFAVIKPTAGLPTQAIFQSPHLMRSESLAIVAGSFAGTYLDCRNDLQAAAEAASEEVGQALRLLRARFGNSRMTGSGSAVFAEVAELVESAPPQATRLEDCLQLPDRWEGRICRSLESLPLAGWIPG
ncbi:4-(cytidine 5'-diphospho)-2-C-methyl-D-erythritol kinase [Inhella sp.]|uniref:4-(cytidine 5'-diphospho)-2-C-methyl-D-erythritol kinase n=1 Tax=Inhella sp. TaxID=1921806 RepID=UPI0035B2E83A